MSSAFPGSVDSFTDPTASDKLSSPNHAVLHQDVNDAIEKTETKVGTGSSTPTDRAVFVGTGVGASAWEASPNNLTFDTPNLNTPDFNGTELILDADADTSITADTDDQIDIKINGADDFQFTPNTFTVLAGSNLKLATGTSIVDNSGNEVIKQTATASAVNEFTVVNAATGNAPALNASGDDTNIDIDLVPKGTGVLKVSGVALTGAWTTWTPTWVNLTVGNGTVTAYYKQVGKTVLFRLNVLFGSTTSISGTPTFTLPVTAIALVGADSATIATGKYLDSGTAAYQGLVMLNSTTTGQLQLANASATYLTYGGISSTTPMTWTTSDEIKFLNGCYEAA